MVESTPGEADAPAAAGGRGRVGGGLAALFEPALPDPAYKGLISPGADNPPPLKADNPPPLKFCKLHIQARAT